MPFEVTRAPGGGPSVGQALGGVLEDVNKDKLAMQALEMPGLRESMGSDVADWITKGPGAHRRLGSYIAQQDKLSGGKVSQMNRVVQIVTKGLEGQKNVSPEKVLQLGYQAAEQVNAAGTGPAVSREDVSGLHKQIFQGVGRTRAAARPAKAPKETEAEIIARARQNPEFMSLVQSKKQWKQLTTAERLTATSALTGQTGGSAVLRAQRIFGTPTLMEQLLQLGAEGGAADLGVPGAPTAPAAAPGVDLDEAEADRLIQLGRGR